MKYLFITLSSIVVVYLVILVFIYFYQRNLLYHPSENNYQNDEVEFNYEEVNIEVEIDSLDARRLSGRVELIGQYP